MFYFVYVVLLQKTICFYLLESVQFRRDDCSVFKHRFIHCPLFVFEALISVYIFSETDTK